MVRLVPGYVDPPETGPGFRKDKQRPVDPYSLWLDRRPPGFSVPPMENPQESVPHNNWIFPPEDNPARDYNTGIQGVGANRRFEETPQGINPFLVGDVVPFPWQGVQANRRAYVDRFGKPLVPLRSPSGGVHTAPIININPFLGR